MDDYDDKFEFGSLMVCEQDGLNTPGVLVGGGFWDLKRDTRQKILEGWMTSLEEVFERSEHYISDADEFEIVDETKLADILQFPTKE